jgi:hypothetical protein
LQQERTDCKQYVWISGIDTEAGMEVNSWS